MVIEHRIYRLLKTGLGGEGEQDNFFACDGTDVVVHTDRFDACDLVDQRL